MKKKTVEQCPVCEIEYGTKREVKKTPDKKVERHLCGELCKGCFGDYIEYTEKKKELINWALPEYERLHKRLEEIKDELEWLEHDHDFAESEVEELQDDVKEFEEDILNPKTLAVIERFLKNATAKRRRAAKKRKRKRRRR